MIETLYIHIGTEKTGSTSIQKALNQNKGALKSEGIGFAPTLTPKGIGYARKLILASENFNYKISDILDDFIRQYESYNQIVISHELFHSRLNSKEKVEFFASAITPLFKNIKIICYFRSQVSVCKSLYSTALKSNNYMNSSGELIKGFVPPLDEFISEANSSNMYYNYYEMIKLWESAFGKESLILSKFSKEDFYCQNLVADFFKKIGVEKIQKTQYNSNSSLDETGIYLMKALNKQYKGNNRKELVRKVSESFPGKGPRITENQVNRIQNEFARSNKALSKRFFNGHFIFEEIAADKSEAEDINFDKILDFLVSLLK